MRRSFYAGSAPIDHRALGLVVLVGIWGRALPAHAEGPLEGTIVHYDAPAGCPAQSDFEARVRARAPNHPATGATPAALQRVDATVRVKGGRASGSVAIADATGATTVRRIAAASCVEVVDALALIVALALDPLQQKEESGGVSGSPGKTASPGESAPTSSTNASETEAPPQPAKPPVSSVPDQHKIKEEPAAPADTERGPSRRIEAARRPHFGAFASGLVATGMAPEAQFGGELSVGVSGGYRRRFSALAGARAAFAQSKEGPEGNARFQWWSAFVALCLGGHVGVDTLWIDGCASFEVGRLGARGSETRNPASGAYVWQALGPGLRAEWVIARPLAFVAGVEGLFPFRRERYLLGPDIAYQVPVVALRAEAGLGVRF